MGYIFKLYNQMNLPTLLKTFGLFLISLFSPILGLVAITIIMSIIDLFFGLYRVYYLKERFIFSKMFNIVYKVLFYIVTIAVAFLVDTYVFGGKFPFIDIENLLAKVITIFWTWIELKSIDKSSVAVGNKPFDVIIKELISFAKGIKKDVDEIKN